MFINTIKSVNLNLSKPFIKRVTSYSQIYNWPINFNFKDTILKYSKYSYSIINNMEDNFETKLINIGK